MRPLREGGGVDLVRMRHSAAHVMAAAVCRLFPNVKLDIGPATEDGFYYDFDLPHRLTPQDFPAIEEEMARLVALDLPFDRFELSREDAAARLKAAGQTYKLDRLEDIPPGQPITFYRCGDFEDLCRGPHVARTSDIGPFKLIGVAGSYFRGLETNPMLQRLYGVVAESREALETILHRQEEARRRDHRKLGRELQLFSLQDDVGPGLVHWHPRGARVRALIEAFWRERHLEAGYDLLYTPHMGRAHLWQLSGHLEFYRESMYAPMDIDGEDYFVKPMNCPFHIQVYRSEKRSYRDLPLRWAELGTVYRYEKSGVLHGLFRVRGFTQDDAHIFCTPDQIAGEVAETVRFALRMLRAFGFDQVSAYLSTRPHKAVGEPQRWVQATASLEQALQAAGLSYQRDEGGGAFYGPKIDLKIRDAIGREWQLSTIQFDFNLPERFDLTYVGPDGAEHRPYMVHRALLGSLERFFAILIEHHAGAFPFWLAPEQVRVLPLTEKQMDYAETVRTQLASAGLRCTVDRHSEKIGAKIRRATEEKVPYLLVVGPREVQTGQIAVRARRAGDQGAMPLEVFLERTEGERHPPWKDGSGPHQGAGVQVSSVDRAAEGPAPRGIGPALER